MMKDLKKAFIVINFIENYDHTITTHHVQPNSGPPMHVHWLQDEGFTVVKGK